MKIWYVWFLE
jgi:hypothetical protein